jgi:molybdenum ABC transporter molybdate-binding protein
MGHTNTVVSIALYRSTKRDMNCLVFAIAFFLVGMAALRAQTATPATPADPNQARPAVPVVPDSLTPPQMRPDTSTNAAPTTASGPSLPIIADSSLKQVLQELAQSWADAQDSNPQVPLTLTNAGTLRAKIEAGSTWDVVISADVQDMVIYGRKALVKDDELDWFDLIGSEWKKVALGNPELTASGRVASRALQKHDLLNGASKDFFVYTPTEALALAVVEREQADAVFLYKTDLPKTNLHGFDVFPLTTDDAPPIFYMAAVSRLAKNPELARAFIDYCDSEAARAIWAKYGFETN